MARRSENFSSKEKIVFSEIVKSHDVVECKAYNRDTLQRKKVAWKKITEAFNSSFPQNPPRDTKNLLGLWRRLKLQAKRKISKTTGGGTPPSPLTPLDENVLEMLGNTGEPLDNPYDDEGEVAQIPAEGVAVQLSVLSDRELEGGDCPDIEVKEEGMEDVIESTGETSSPQTPSVKSRKSRHKEDEDDEVVKMMQEIHKKQLRVLELQERKALLDIYLIEQEIKRKGYNLPEWHNNSVN
ncbi:uncharacterized protein [Anabrus simplex]|uniref:uncharacterized protein n=1 Tax=Anabrus simplex TaxID=316456 RepID=UPI0034DD2946